MAKANRLRWEMWEVGRYIAFNAIQLSPDIKKAQKPRRPEDVLSLPTDIKKEIVYKPITEDELIALRSIGFIN